LKREGRRSSFVPCIGVGPFRSNGFPIALARRAFDVKAECGFGGGRVYAALISARLGWAEILDGGIGQKGRAFVALLIASASLPRRPPMQVWLMPSSKRSKRHRRRTLHCRLTLASSRKAAAP